MEIVCGHSIELVISETALRDLFGDYRSPWKA